MGLDYIRAQTGKSWRKRWNGGLNRLKTPSLLDLTMSEAARTVTVQLTPGCRIKAGDKLIVQNSAGSLTVSDGLHAIGQVTNPSSELVAGILASGGYAEGMGQRMGLFGDTAEISLK